VSRLSTSVPWLSKTWILLNAGSNRSVNQIFTVPGDEASLLPTAGSARSIKAWAQADGLQTNNSAMLNIVFMGYGLINGLPKIFGKTSSK
jgi:hypothetical protein